MFCRVVLIILGFLSAGLFAQKENISSFNSVTLTYNFHPKWFLYMEGQLRGIEDYTYPDYYELKGGVGFNLTGNHKPFVGVGRYVNYKARVLSREEVRLWLQDVFVLKKGSLRFENRLRAEQSWFFEPEEHVSSKRNRYRYRLNISMPLNSKKMEPGTLFANVYDEVFFVSPMKPTFARNRVYGGFGYVVDDHFGIATGYLWQREFEAKGHRNLHYLYLALNITIDYKAEHEKVLDFPGAD